MWRTVEVALSERRAVRIDLARVDVAAFGERRRHRKRGVPAEGADLEHVLRLGDEDKRLKKPPRDRAGQHRLRPQRACRLLRELGEQGVVWRRQPLCVLLDAGVRDVHGR